MKTYTPKEAAQAMLDGKALTDGQDKYEWSDLAGCYVVVKEEIGDTSRTEATTMLLRVPDNLYDYEPAKPENKVIVIEEAKEHNAFEVSIFGGAYHDTENDAIRAVMEWIGEKADRLTIKKPNWGFEEYPVSREKGGISSLSRYAILEALLMRWPIEVIEEV